MARGISGFWDGLSSDTRRRLAAAALLVVTLTVLFALLVGDLPCQLPGGDSCPPADDAAELVPPDALAYLHANLDPETEQAARLAGLAGDLPVLSGQIAGRALAGVPGPGGHPPDFERDLGPWFGGELAVAVLAGAGDRPQQVELLEVGDDEAAASFAEAIASGPVSDSEHRGVALSVDRRGLASAQVEGFLAIGPRFGVRAVIDTATGSDDSSLAADSAAEEIRAELPERRVADAYLSEDGAVALLSDSAGALGSLTPVVAPGASRGAAASLTATEENGLELAVRSALDPERSGSAPEFFAAFPGFEPKLPERLPADSLGYLGLGEPATTIRALLAQANVQAPGIAAGFERLADRLRREGGLDLERELLGALGGEAAFVIAPHSEGERIEAPYLELVAAEVDEEGARRALASLQAPLAEAVDTGRSLQAPVFGQREIAGVDALSLRVSPTVELTYAVFEELAVIASDPVGVERLIAGEGGLDGSDSFERATEGLDDGVSLLAFFDLGALILLGERLGLAEDPVYATFAGEFRRLEALGIAVHNDDGLLATDVRLLIDSD